MISVLSCLAIFGGRETSVKTHFCGVAVKPELLTHSLQLLKRQTRHKTPNRIQNNVRNRKVKKVIKIQS